MQDFDPRVPCASRCAGVPLADVYLEFLAGRCRANTVLAAAFDLRVFFSVETARRRFRGQYLRQLRRLTNRAQSGES